MQGVSGSVSQVLTDKLDSILANYPTYPYQAALGHGATKQLLLDYVECKLKQGMPSLNAPDQWQRLPQYLHQFVDLELRLESYIYWGIEYIIQNQFDLLLGEEDISVPTCNVQDMTQTCMPAHWFG